MDDSAFAVATPSLERCKQGLLLHKVPMTNQSMSPPPFNLENQWVHCAYSQSVNEGLLAESWVAPKQLHRQVFTHSHISGTLLQVTSPNLYTLGPLRPSNHLQLGQNHKWLGGVPESPVTLLATTSLSMDLRPCLL